MATESSSSPAPSPLQRVRRRHPSLPPLHDPQPSLLSQRIYDMLRSDKASTYSDVWLTSIDGIHFPAVRMILAISSPYFEKLLNSPFSEKNRRCLSVNLKSTTLKEVLRFVYRDDCYLLRQVRLNERKFSCQAVEDLVGLALAADYLSMDRLLSACAAALTRLIHQDAHYCSVVWEALRPHQVQLLWSTDLICLVRQAVMDYPKRALVEKFHLCELHCGIMHFSPNTLEDVFSRIIYKILYPDTMFQALLIWASNGVRTSPKRVSGYVRIVDPANLPITGERLACAKEMAVQFVLTDFKPSFFFDIVEPSGLCDPLALRDASKRLLLQYENRVKELESQLANTVRSDVEESSHSEDSSVLKAVFGSDLDGFDEMESDSESEDD